MSKSLYLARKVLDHALGVAAYPMPAGVWLALFNGVGGLLAGNLAEEVSGGAYVRQPVTFHAATEAEGAVNNGAVEFPVATSDWGDMVGWALMDASTEGNVLHWGEFPQYGDPAEHKSVFVGDSFRIRDGDLTLTEA